MTADPAGGLGERFTVAGYLDVPSAAERRAALVGDVIRLFDPSARRGVTLTLLAGGGGRSSPGDALRVAFGVDDATEPVWEDCGKPDPDSHYVSNSLTVAGGDLYAAATDSRDPDRHAHVYRYRGGKLWVDLGRPGGSDTDARGIGPMIDHDGALHVGAWTPDPVAAAAPDRADVRVWRLGPSQEWIDLGAPGSCRSIFALASYRGDLYAAGDDAGLYVRRGGSWHPVRRFAGDPQVLYVHDGLLWVGTATPGRLWYFDGGDWREEPLPDGIGGIGGGGGDGIGEIGEVQALACLGDDLLVGTWPRGRVLRRTDAGTWSTLPAIDGAYGVDALAGYNGSLYAGSLPYAELSRLDGDRWSEIIRFNVREGWTPASVAESGWRPRAEQASAVRTPPPAPPGTSPGMPPGIPSAIAGMLLGTVDRGMRDWGRVTALAEFAGKLFVATGNATSAVADTGEYRVLGTVYAASTGVAVTAPHPLAPGRHHLAAVRDGLAVRLHIDGECVAQRQGKRHRPIDLTGPLPRSGTGLADETWFDRALGFAEIGALARGETS